MAETELFGDHPEKRPVHWKEDGYDVTRTLHWSPHGCHPTGCGLKMYVKDGKLEKVEGDEMHPLTHGALCVRCLAYPEWTHSDKRIIYPMKRDPKDRGKDDKWERCSWDDAWALVKKHADATIENYGRESIAVYVGTGYNGSMYAAPLAFRSFGTPNLCYMQDGWSCMGPRIGVTIFTTGIPYIEFDSAGAFEKRFDDPRYELSECVMVWGKEPLKSNADGTLGHSLVEIMKRGTELIVVDPCVTWLASKAKYHLQLRPGTDTALAMAMLNVIIKEELYDKEFCDMWVFGLEDLAERVEPCTPEWASEITWVPADKIAAAARFWANSRPGSLYWGVASADQKPNGVQAGLSLMALTAICGNIDAPGGQAVLGWPAGSMQWEWGIREMPEGLIEKQIGKYERPAVNAVFQFANPDLMLEALETGVPYPIKFNWFNSANPLANPVGVPRRYLEAFLHADYNVCTDIVMNPTAASCCDLFLPVSMATEGSNMVSLQYGQVGTLTGACNKALQVGECHTDIELMIEVGKLMRPELWEDINTEEDVLNAMAVKPMLGIDYEELSEYGWVQAPYEYRKYEKGLMRPDGQPGFMTPTGRIELYATIYEGYGDDPLPYYEEPPQSPISTPEAAEKYPFVLTTGARTWPYFHSSGREIPVLRQIRPNPLFKINPEDAEKLGITSGDWCWLENQFGKCKMVADVTRTILPGVISSDHGFYYPERKGEASEDYMGSLEANPNNLMPHGYNGKMGFGNTFKCQLCSVAKAD